MHTADDILAIPRNEPERLFQTPDQIVAAYHKLAMRWHPDKPDGRREVFEHLTALKQEAELHVSEGRWQIPGLLEIAGRKIRYFKSYPFELGMAYLGNTVLALVVEEDFLTLAKNAEAAIKGMEFANDRMAAEMQPRLPRLKAAFDTGKGQRVLVEEKQPGLIRLSDLIVHQGGKIDPRHAAWIISDLLNTACYFGAYRQISHMGLATETVFIDPAAHRTVIAGGWFYTTALGEPLMAIPERTDQLLPAVARHTERATGSIDLELIKGIGREMLGDVSGTHLDTGVPAALRDWLRMPSGMDAVAEYKAWPKILEDSFGARRFTELPVTASDIYGKDA
jgi:hypothetical protein